MDKHEYARLTQAEVDRQRVVVVSVLADLVEMFQVGVCVELGHFLHGGQLGFNGAGDTGRKIFVQAAHTITCRVSSGDSCC